MPARCRRRRGVALRRKPCSLSAPPRKLCSIASRLNDWWMPRSARAPAAAKAFLLGRLRTSADAADRQGRQPPADLLLVLCRVAAPMHRLDALRTRVTAAV